MEYTKRSWRREKGGRGLPCSILVPCARNTQRVGSAVIPGEQRETWNPGGFIHRHRVLKKGKVLFARDLDALYALAFRTAQEFEDFKPIYRTYLAEVARGGS